MKRFLFVATAAILLFTPFCTYAQINLDSGLVAYYPFNGNADDETTNGYDGFVFGATLTTDKFGKGNSAYLFDGTDDYIDLGDRQGFRFKTDFSISLWIEYPGGKQNAAIIYKWNGQVPNEQYGIGVLGLQCCYTSFPSNYISSFNRHDQNFNDKILSGERDTLSSDWYHVVLNNSISGKAFLYINNHLVDSSANSSGTFEILGKPLIVGATGYFDRQFFSGKIDEIRIYNRLLIGVEIDSLFNGVNANTSTGNTDLTSLSLFPNPSTTTFHLHAELPTPSQPTYTVLNQLGQVVWQAREVQSVQVIDQQINLSSQPNGIYHLRISDGNGSISRQLVLQR